MIDLVFRRWLITFGLTVNTERHLRGVRVRTNGSKLLKIQSDELFGTDKHFLLTSPFIELFFGLKPDPEQSPAEAGH